MSQSSRTHLTDSKVRVHKDRGRWQVTFPRDCPDLSFRRAPIPARRKRLMRAVR